MFGKVTKPHEKHRRENNIEIHLTEIKLGMYETEWNKFWVRNGDKTYPSQSSAQLLSPWHLLSRPRPPPPHSSHVFRLYVCSFSCLCYWRWRTGGAQCDWGSRWPPRTPHHPCSFFPWPNCSTTCNPVVDTVCRQWSSFHSSIKAANLLTCRRLNVWQRQKILGCSGFHEPQKHNTK